MKTPLIYLAVRPLGLWAPKSKFLGVFSVIFYSSLVFFFFFFFFGTLRAGKNWPKQQRRNCHLETLLLDPQVHSEDPVTIPCPAVRPYSTICRFLLILWGRFQKTTPYSTFCFLCILWGRFIRKIQIGEYLLFLLGPPHANGSIRNVIVPIFDRGRHE